MAAIARSVYFASMFKSDNFKESSGKVRMPCNKKVMGKIIEYLYVGVFNPATLIPEEKLHLLNMFRMMLLHDAFVKLEDNFIRVCVSHIDSNEAVASLTKYVDILDLALSLNLATISSELLLRLDLFLPKIVDTIIDEELAVPNAVVFALANAGTDVFSTFRLINHFKNTTFVEEQIPDINLEALTVDQLEKDVASSGLYKESDVLKVIVAKQKEEIEQLNIRLTFKARGTNVKMVSRREGRPLKRSYDSSN